MSHNARVWTVMVGGALALAACTAQDGINTEGQTFTGIGADEEVTLIGTEPFWNLRVAGGEAVWSTPEQHEGTRFAVKRFAGNNGLGFSGTLAGEAFTATVTPGTCSDGMSDRSFPFTATVRAGERTLAGCAYSSRSPFTGPAAP